MDSNQGIENSKSIKRINFENSSQMEEDDSQSQKSDSISGSNHYSGSEIKAKNSQNLAQRQTKEQKTNNSDNVFPDTKKTLLIDNNHKTNLFGEVSRVQTSYIPLDFTKTPVRNISKKSIKSQKYPKQPTLINLSKTDNLELENKEQWLQNVFGIKYYREQQIKLKQAFKNTKVFLNMVVHDLRNPSTQINFSINNVLENMQKIPEFGFSISNLQNETNQIIQELKDEIQQLQNEVKRLNEIIRNKEKREDIRDYIERCKSLVLSCSNSSEEEDEYECDINTVLSCEGQTSVEKRLQDLGCIKRQKSSKSTPVLPEVCKFEKLNEKFKSLIKLDKDLQSSKQQCSQMLEVCNHSSGTLINLINDLLDLAKQENQTFQFYKQFTNILNVVSLSMSTLEFMASKKKINMEVVINPKHVKYFENLYCDEKRFEQIFLNFISNALKFTDQGGNVKVQITCEKLIKASIKNGKVFASERSNEPSDEQRLMAFLESQDNKSIIKKLANSVLNSKNSNKPQSAPKRVMSESVREILSKEQRDLFFNQFCIMITDNGHGISQDGIEKLFINFEALKEHQNSNQRGTGLGLSICKQIIEKMGGKIEVISKLGEGTTFKINLIILCLVPDYAPGSKSNKRASLNCSIKSHVVDDSWMDDNSQSYLNNFDASQSKDFMHLPKAGSLSREYHPFSRSNYDSSFKDFQQASKSSKVKRMQPSRNTECAQRSDYNFQNTNNDFFLQHSMDLLMESINSDYVTSHWKTEFSKENQIQKTINIIQEIEEKSMKDEVSNSSDLVLDSKAIKSKLSITEENNQMFSDRNAIMDINESSEFETEKIKVLLVNDEPMNILILQTMFDGLECETSTALNGLDAVRQARTTKYDVIIMDLEMPVMNGFEACFRIKQNGNNDYVVAFTSNTLNQELIAKMKSYQFDNWFMTPVANETIKNEILMKFKNKDLQSMQSEEEAKSEPNKRLTQILKRNINTIAEENSNEESTIFKSAQAQLGYSVNMMQVTQNGKKFTNGEVLFSSNNTQNQYESDQ